MATPHLAVLVNLFLLISSAAWIVKFGDRSLLVEATSVKKKKEGKYLSRRYSNSVAGCNLCQME